MLGNFVEESTNAPGAATTVNLAGAPAGRVPWLSRFTSGSLAFYVMSDSTQAEAGIGYATAGSPNTFNRQTVLWNSQVGTTSPGRLNFAGTTKIYNEVPAERMLWADQQGIVNLPGLIVGKGATPIGAGMDHFGSVLPSGWLWCNGAAVGRTTYASLFVAIGTTFGAGDGATTFNLPDAMGRAVIGREGMGGATAPGRVTTGGSALDGSTLGAAGGDQRVGVHGHTASSPPHSHTASSPPHTHTASSPPHTHQSGSPLVRNLYPTTGLGYRLGTSGTDNFDPNSKDTSAAVAATVTVDAATATVTVNNATATITVANGGTGAAGNIPPALVANKIIFAGV
jgi:microcystin-dependent protein